MMEGITSGQGQEQGGERAVIEALEQKTDEELQAMAAAIDAEIQAREKRRKKDAMDKIKALARDAGLEVELKEKPKRKRGRPAKGTGS